MMKNLHEKVTHNENIVVNDSLKDSRWLAKRLGISWEKARALGRENKVPTIRIGRLIKYDEKAIDKWIHDHIKLSGEK